jgi:hypothetical protein
MRGLWNRLSIGWCRMFHLEPFRPVHGHYRCPTCLRSYPVPWQEGDDFTGRERATTLWPANHPLTDTGARY